MSNRNEIKSLAKLAKQRLKSGFWEECRENVNESLTRAKEEGENTSNVIRYYKSEVARVISNKNEDLIFVFKDISSSLIYYYDKLKMNFNRDLTDNIIKRGIAVKTNEIMEGKKCKKNIKF